MICLLNQDSFYKSSNPFGQGQKHSNMEEVNTADFKGNILLNCFFQFTLKDLKGIINLLFPVMNIKFDFHFVSLL